MAENLRGLGDDGHVGVGGEKEVSPAQSGEAEWTTVQPSKPKVSHAEKHVLFIVGNAMNVMKHAWSSGRITGSPSTRSWVQSPLEVFRELNFSLHNILLPARTLISAGAVYGVTAPK